MVNIGVIGYGYWGPNLVRNFSHLDSCRVKTVADLNEKRLGLVKKLYTNTQVTRSVDDIFLDPEIDGVVIATPVSTHYEFSKAALLQGKNVLIEKPMASSRDQCLDLIDIALKKNKTLMVDHTFLYTGAVRKIKELVSNDHIGEIQYFDSTRINLGLFQNDINVIWDLAPHDISILQFLVDEKPYSVVASGISHTENKIENIAYVTVYYNTNKIAHFNCSWTSPVKIRKILIGGTKKMIVYDDIEPTEKIKVYDTGYNVTTNDVEKILVDYRTGDIFTPKIDQAEALSGVANDFIKAIETGKEPLSNWKVGLSVVNILEAADKSLKQNGSEVLLGESA